jgi:hypothetical protein
LCHIFQRHVPCPGLKRPKRSTKWILTLTPNPHSSLRTRTPNPHILIVKLRRNGERRAVASTSFQGRILLNSRSQKSQKSCRRSDRELTLPVVIYSFINSGSFPKSVRRKGRGYTRLCYSLPQIRRSSLSTFAFGHVAVYASAAKLDSGENDLVKAILEGVRPSVKAIYRQYPKVWYNMVVMRDNEMQYGEDLQEHPHERKLKSPLLILSVVRPTCTVASHTTPIEFDELSCGA